MSRGTHEQVYAQVFKIEDGGVVVLVHQRQMEYVLAKRLRKPQIIDEQRNAFNGDFLFFSGFSLFFGDLELTSRVACALGATDESSFDQPR